MKTTTNERMTGDLAADLANSMEAFSNMLSASASDMDVTLRAAERDGADGSVLGILRAVREARRTIDEQAAAQHVCGDGDRITK